jgi:nucleotide-binding universal stress UspA family protein
MASDNVPSDAVREAVQSLSFEPATPDGPEAVERALAFTRVVAAFDGSGPSKGALAWAAKLAAVYAGSVEVVTAVTPKRSIDRYGILQREVLGAEIRLAEGLAGDAKKIVEEAGVAATTRVVEGEAGPALADHATKTEADLIVVGSHGQSAVRRFLLGSVSDHVKNQATEHNVLIARNKPEGAAIVAAVDGSAPSVRAAAVAIRLGKAWDVPVTVLHVIPSTVLALSEDVQRAFEESAAALELPSWNEPGIRFERTFGSVARGILDTADAQGAGLIVMGARGLGNVRRHMVGSVSGSVCHHAKQSVLLMR